MQKITGQFISDGLETIIDVGFVPNKVKSHLDDGTNPDIITWFQQMTLRATPIFGYVLTGSSGIVTRLTTAATGISAYDSQINGVMVDSPVPGKGKMEVPISEYATLVSGSTTPTARTGAIIGTITKPSTRNGRVYECTTSIGACLAEPTWGTTLGGTTTDSATNVWTCRREDNVVGGAKGFVLGADASQNDDGNIIEFEAERSDVDSDLGDVGNYAAGQVVKKSQ